MFSSVIYIFFCDQYIFWDIYMFSPTVFPMIDMFFAIHMFFIFQFIWLFWFGFLQSICFNLQLNFLFWLFCFSFKLCCDLFFLCYFMQWILQWSHMTRSAKLPSMPDLTSDGILHHLHHSPMPVHTLSCPPSLYSPHTPCKLYTQ